MTAIHGAHRLNRGLRDHIHTTVIAFLAIPCGGAVAPHYKGDEAKLHKTAAKVAGACAVAWAMATCWEIVALSLVAYVAVMQITESRWAWIAAELTGMAMVYAVCFYKLTV